MYVREEQVERVCGGDGVRGGGVHAAENTPTFDLLMWSAQS